jgi:hypothetical protein
MAKHINLKASLKRDEECHKQRPWHDTTSAEIEAFLSILLYMSCTILSRIRNYWNTDPNRAVHALIVNFMSIMRWEQIKRYLKISSPLENKSFDTRGPDWWKKLESLTSDFRTASKLHWLPDSHVSVDEQLIKFKKRSCHTMQIASKTTEVEFKIYSLCQQNYLYDFLFSSKIWSRNIEKLYAKWLISCSAS